MAVTKLNDQLINQWREQNASISHMAPGGDSHIVQMQDGTYLPSAIQTELYGPFFFWVVTCS